jgi:hypothetical protein
MESATVQSGTKTEPSVKELSSAADFCRSVSAVPSKQNGWRTAKDLHPNRIAMSSLPVSGYFKQLNDYYVAKAERSNHSAQTKAAGQTSASQEFPTDSVSLSSDSVELTRPVRPPNAYCYLDHTDHFGQSGSESGGLGHRR